METKGNIALLEKHKIGFLAGRKVAPLSVLPTLDWVSEVAKRDDVSVVSGFHSQLERQVLDFLLRGQCGIICVLGRSLYSRIPVEFSGEYTKDRILFVTEEKYVRVSKETACRRNKLVLSLANEMVIPEISDDSSLRTLLSDYNKPITYL